MATLELVTHNKNVLKTTRKHVFSVSVFDLVPLSSAHFIHINEGDTIKINYKERICVLKVLRVGEGTLRLQVVRGFNMFY